MNAVFTLLDLRNGIHQIEQTFGTDAPFADRRSKVGQRGHRTEEHLHIGVERHQFTDRHLPFRDHVAAEPEHRNQTVDHELIHHNRQGDAPHGEIERHVERRFEFLHEVPVLGTLLAEGFHHLDAVDHLGEVGGHLRHVFAQHHRTAAQRTPKPGKHEVHHRQHHRTDQRQLRAEHDQHDAYEKQRKKIGGHSDDHRRNHRLKCRHVGQDVGNQFPRPIFLVETQRQTLQMLEKLDPQIKEHPLHRIVGEIVARVKEERPHPVEQDHPAEQHEEKTVIGSTERFVDDDLENQRHQQPETGAAHVEDNAYSQQSAIRFDKTVQLPESLHNPTCDGFPMGFAVCCGS